MLSHDRKELTFPTLGTLLGDVPVSEFFERYWEQDVLFVPAASRCISEFTFDIEDVDAVLSRTPIPSHFIRVVKPGEEVALDSLATDTRFGHCCLSERVFGFLRDGYSVVVQFLDRCHLGARKFTGRLSYELSLRVHLNVYVSPPGAGALPVHFDGHDVFVVQLFGSKTWEIYGRCVDYPEEGSSGKAFRNKNFGEPSLVVELNPGDVLYVPRGIPHRAVSSPGTMSVHSTYGLKGLSWGELAQARLELSLQKSADSRRVLPPGFARSPVLQTRVLETLRELWAALPDNWDTALGAAVDNAEDACGAELSGHLLELGRAFAGLYPSVFCVRPGIVGSVSIESDSIGLRFHGKRLLFPLECEQLVRDIVAEVGSFGIAKYIGSSGDSSLVIETLYTIAWVRLIRFFGHGENTGLKASNAHTCGYRLNG